MNKEEIIQKIKNCQGSKIKIATIDIDGILRGKYIHKHKFLDAINSNIGICDVVFGWDSGDICYENSELTGWHTGYPDAKAMIDVSTFREIPWENSIPFFLVDFSQHEKYAETACPRSLLKKVAGECETMGFKAYFAQEFEWFNFKGTPSEISQNGYSKLEPITPGMFGYSVLRTSLNESYFNDLFDGMESFGIPLEGVHTETGPGVFETAILHDEIISAADKATLFKTGVKEIAYRNGMVASFMAKWNKNLPGCGGHLHQSLWDRERKSNLFFSEKESGISELMEQYIAGQLACLPEILPMFAPTVNSYKRLGHGDWAPSTISWGFDNRTASLRVIRGKNESTRIESRVPGADTNAYLAMAAALASGLYGIKNRLKLKTTPIVGNGYENKGAGVLANNLMDATRIMVKSEIAKQLFGAPFVNHFTKTREWEWQQYMNQVTDWELERYFEII